MKSPSFINALYQFWLNCPSGSGGDENVQRQPKGNNNNNDGKRTRFNQKNYIYLYEQVEYQ